MSDGRIWAGLALAGLAAASTVRGAAKGSKGVVRKRAAPWPVDVLFKAHSSSERTSIDFGIVRWPDSKSLETTRKALRLYQQGEEMLGGHVMWGVEIAWSTVWWFDSLPDMLELDDSALDESEYVVLPEGVFDPDLLSQAGNRDIRTETDRMLVMSDLFFFEGNTKHGSESLESTEFPKSFVDDVLDPKKRKR